MITERGYCMIDLGEINLFRANLKRINLEKTNLTETNLEEADLNWTMLAGANLMGTKLEKANLEGANLRKANLRGRDLEGANLEEAIFEGANLKGALDPRIDKLSKVRTLYNAKLDEEFLIQLKEEFSFLFKSLEQQFLEYQHNHLGAISDNL